MYRHSMNALADEVQIMECTCISRVALLVCVLCQPVHSLSHPYISCLEIFLWRFVSVLF